LAALAASAPQAEQASKVSVLALSTAVDWSADPYEALAAGHSRLESLRALGQVESAERLLPELTYGARNSARSAAAAGGGALGRDLWMMAARYAEFTGWMAHETGDETAASAWTDVAALWAARGGDVDMAGYRWERHALVTLYRGDGPGTVALARRAGVRRTASTRVLALALRREAQGHALSGDASAFRRAMDAAGKLIAGAPAPYPSGPSWGPNTIEDSTSIIEASSLVDLGLHRAAVRLFGPDPASAMPVAAARTRARFVVRAALAHASAGAVDHACGLLEREVPGLQQLGSATIRADLSRLAIVFTRHRRLPTVRAILPELHRLIRPHGIPEE
jgi:hypothetical protein